MAAGSSDHFARLRRLVAAQHRDCLAQRDELRSARAAIERSRRLLLELDQEKSIYNKPFASEPSHAAGDHPA
jgi:hypothetical protein